MLANINVNQLTMTTMCQGSRLMGMSSTNEHTLESYFRKIVRCSGPEFLVKKLKVLEHDTIRRLENPQYQMPRDQLTAKIDTPLAWSHKYDRPKGPFSIIYKTWPNLSSRLRGIGMLKNSIALEHPSKKQLQKLLDGVNVDGKESDHEIIPMMPNDARRFVKAVNIQMKHQKKFSGLDLTGTLMPFGNLKQISVSQARKELLSEDPDKRHHGIATMSYVYDAQWKTAPRTVKTFIKKHIDSMKNLNVDLDDGLIARPTDYSSKYNATGRFDHNEYAGTVSFLQKPSAKLRSVFNTNRLINYAMTPYAKGIENAFYKQYPHNIFVKRQDKGMEAIQQMLRKGRTLTSADLSSATDRLNFRGFTNGLRNQIVVNALRRYYHKDDNWDPKWTHSKEVRLSTYKGWEELEITHSGILSKEDKNALDSIDTFENVAEMPFYSHDLKSALALRTGQPLGMMGSFQTLTAMNFCMGRVAEVVSTNSFSKNIPSFAVVGDDFVGDTHIMDAYHQVVTQLNGKDNSEKAMHSDKYGEFCSHLISKSNVVAFKPKFHLGHDSLWLNAEKSSVKKTLHVYRLNDEDKQALETLADIGDPTLSYMGTVASSSKKPRKERLIINAALQQIGLESSQSRDPLSVSPLTEDYSREEAMLQSRGRSDYSDYGVMSYNDPFGNTTIIGISHPVPHHENDEFSTEETRFDHHVGKQVVKQSVRRASLSKRKRARLAKELVDTYENGNEHLFKKPYHKDSKISSTELLLQGINSVEKGTSDFIDRQPYPAADHDNELRNQVDVSRATESVEFDPSLVDQSIKTKGHDDKSTPYGKKHHRSESKESTTSNGKVKKSLLSPEFNALADELEQEWHDKGDDSPSF